LRENVLMMEYEVSGQGKEECAKREIDRHTQFTKQLPQSHHHPTQKDNLVMILSYTGLWG